MCRADEFESAIRLGCTNFRIHLGLRHRDQVGYLRNLRIAEKMTGIKCDAIIDFPTSRPRLDGFVEKFVKKDENIHFAAEQNGVDEIIITGLEKFIDSLQEHQHIYCRDGKVAFRILEVDVKNCKVLAVCVKSTIKLIRGGSVVFPSADIEFIPIVKEDKIILETMKREELNPDWLCLSFASNKKQINELRSFSINLWGEDKKIISKIEHKKGILNADEIIEHSDSIMIGRGDLSLHVNPIQLPKIQAMLMKKVILKKKIAIIATEFLESFSSEAVIHRSEITDIATAVRQGANALLLARETSNSNRPLECIRLMKSIMREEMIDEVYL